MFRRELSIDVTEHRSISKNNQNSHNLRFNLTPKTGKNSLKQVFRFCEELVVIVNRHLFGVRMFWFEIADARELVAAVSVRLKLSGILTTAAERRTGSHCTRTGRC